MGGRNRALVDLVRGRCAEVAHRARQVRIVRERIPVYAASLTAESTGPRPPEAHRRAGDQGELTAYWLTLDAINFGSGWFPTLRKRPGASGYFTIAAGLRERFASHGPWSAGELASLDPGELGPTLGQDPDHELIALFAASLNDLGRRLCDGYEGDFTGPVREAEGSAVGLVEILAGWECFADASRYGELEVPFLKRAQIAAADLSRSGGVAFGDLDRLTMFADNLVPHVLRLDGVLEFASELVERIESGALIEHGSPEEVEIRACALHAVELMVAAEPGLTAAEIDVRLWERGQGTSYKARPRHRSRCTAY